MVMARNVTILEREFREGLVVKVTFNQESKEGREGARWDKRRNSSLGNRQQQELWGRSALSRVFDHQQEGGSRKE